MAEDNTVCTQICIFGDIHSLFAILGSMFVISVSVCKTSLHEAICYEQGIDYANYDE